MKRQFINLGIALFGFLGFSQNQVNPAQIQEDLNDLLGYYSTRYVYYADKQVDMDCIREKYSAMIPSLQNRSDVILFFEYVLNEFYDSHISLSTNLRESYRLWSPIFIELKNGKAIIKNVWQTQLANLEQDILGAEIASFNGVSFDQTIDDFPSLCNDKNSDEVLKWIANKVVAGKYSEPRVLGLKLKDGRQVQFDMDALRFKEDSGLVTTEIKAGIAIVRLNNSLGNNQLISEFDRVLDGLMDTKGLILDLRNTNTGGNTYVAKGIMSRFIDRELPYQKHEYTEMYDNQPAIVRSWYELVRPRGKQYTKPVVVLVGRWTGSMGEGMAVGFDAMKRAPVVGTEMKRLAGSDFDFTFKHQDFRFKIILEKLYHVNGTLREEYVPEHYVKQSTLDKDETLEKGIELIRKVTD
ncbi:S41 family peptidase [Aureitalea marina]|uniref:Tail specific protease domain-containing protein n=1 Tax=Aureitalea marina TaxID=930804 RepID=A0A2S7KQZ7_9FLAO|nr:S41 family peptidase [Aureitalea marina]PQB05041.1 hypothetical protein BST85_09155 [Aureitalea marina]